MVLARALVALRLDQPAATTLLAQMDSARSEDEAQSALSAADRAFSRHSKNLGSAPGLSTAADAPRLVTSVPRVVLESVRPLQCATPDPSPLLEAARRCEERDDLDDVVQVALPSLSWPHIVADATRDAKLVAKTAASAWAVALKEAAAADAELWMATPGPDLTAVDWSRRRAAAPIKPPVKGPTYAAGRFVVYTVRVTNPTPTALRIASFRPSVHVTASTKPPEKRASPPSEIEPTLLPVADGVLALPLTFTLQPNASRSLPLVLFPLHTLQFTLTGVHYVLGEGIRCSHPLPSPPKLTVKPPATWPRLTLDTSVALTTPTPAGSVLHATATFAEGLVYTAADPGDVDAVTASEDETSKPRLHGLAGRTHFTSDAAPHTVRLAVRLPPSLQDSDPCHLRLVGRPFQPRNAPYTPLLRPISRTPGPSVTALSACNDRVPLVLSSPFPVRVLGVFALSDRWIASTVRPPPAILDAPQTVLVQLTPTSAPEALDALNGDVTLWSDRPPTPGVDRAPPLLSGPKEVMRPDEVQLWIAELARTYVTETRSLEAVEEVHHRRAAAAGKSLPPSLRSVRLARRAARERAAAAEESLHERKAAAEAIFAQLQQRADSHRASIVAASRSHRDDPDEDTAGPLAKPPPPQTLGVLPGWSALDLALLWETDTHRGFATHRVFLPHSVRVRITSQTASTITIHIRALGHDHARANLELPHPEKYPTAPVFIGPRHLDLGTVPDDASSLQTTLTFAPTPVSDPQRLLQYTYLTLTHPEDSHTQTFDLSLLL